MGTRGVCLPCQIWQWLDAQAQPSHHITVTCKGNKSSAPASKCKLQCHQYRLNLAAVVLPDGMSSRGVAWRPLLCGTGNCADARVSSRRAPRPHDTFLRHRVAGLLACCRTQPRALCASTSNAPRGPVEPDAFFNRAEELARLQRLLGSTPTAVLLVTGPPSCGKSGACSAEWTVTLASPDSWTGLQRC